MTKEELDLILLRGSTKNKVLGSINHFLKQFKLDGYYDPDEVFNMVYEIAVRRIESGTDLFNLYGWFKATSFNRIRELKQQESKSRSLCNRLRTEQNNSVNSGFNVIEMVDLFEKLDPIDRKILEFHGIGLEWSEIAKRIVEDGDLPYSANLPNTLAQRASRARRKLRSRDE